MGLFLLRFWPVLLPLLAYLSWMFIVRRKARKAGEPLPSFRDGPVFWTLVASLAIAVVLFLWIGASNDQAKGEYIPPHIENGKIIPGKVE